VLRISRKGYTMPFAGRTDRVLRTPEVFVARRTGPDEPSSAL
jgi:hypothetical protein